MKVSDLKSNRKLLSNVIFQGSLIREVFLKFNQAKSTILPVVNYEQEIIGTVSLFDILPFTQDTWKMEQSINPLIENNIVKLEFDLDIEKVEVIHNSIFIYTDPNGEKILLSFNDILACQENIKTVMMEILKNIIESIYCGILVLDNGGKIIIYNASAFNILKISSKDVLGKSIDQVNKLKNFKNVIYQNNGHGRHKFDINDTNVVANLIPLVKNDNKMGTLVIFHESAKEECISQELYVTEKLLREINIFLESSYDGIFITDSTGKVIRVNSSWERIFSVTRNEVVGRNAKDLVQAGIYGKSAALETLGTKKTSTVMFENKGRKIMATGTPVYNSSGKISSTVVNVRDITELENLKGQLEKHQLLAERYTSEIKEMRRQYQEYPGIIKHSKEMDQVMDMVSRVSEFDSTVLITGESGVGKDVVARTIHRLSPRANGPMMKINCGAIPPTLLESELFGYEPGAFTGALAKGKIGLFELANGGTLFLDEIAETSLEVQVKLLRVLQEKEIIKVGGGKTKKIDVRIITATNQDLKEMIRERTFREDLFYRINVITINVPPLRERREDIAPLMFYFLDKFNQQYKKKKRFSSAVINLLCEYNWPGNIRELENLVENLVILAQGDEITIEDLPDSYQRPIIANGQISVNGVMPLKKAIKIVEAQLIQNAKERFGSTRKMAGALGINQSTVVRKMQSLKHR